MIIPFAMLNGFRDGKSYNPMKYTVLHFFLNTFLPQINLCNVMILLVADWLGLWLMILYKDYFKIPKMD